jgi:hypothetical protein
MSQENVEIVRRGYDEFTMAPDELIDANDHQVIVRVHQTARGAQSGAPIDRRGKEGAQTLTLSVGDQSLCFVWSLDFSERTWNW